jgi:hypothetical protein
MRWANDGRSIYAQLSGEIPARVYQVDVSTGRRELAKIFAPSDPAGVMNLGSIHMTPDGRSYIYTHDQNLHDLYLIVGLR